jgi:hypothetical protein
MISRQTRNQLAKLDIPPDCIGFDCNGEMIHDGDKVEVIAEEKERKGNPEYKFCSCGKIGIASLHYSFPAGWVVDVKFETGQNVGCVDYNLRILH